MHKTLRRRIWKHAAATNPRFPLHAYVYCRTNGEAHEEYEHADLSWVALATRRLA